MGIWKWRGGIAPFHYVISHSYTELLSRITVWGGCLHLPLHIKGHAGALVLSHLETIEKAGT